jgi:hypothetical protein
LKFSYEIPESSEAYDLNVVRKFASQRHPSPLERVKVRVEEDGQVSILANKDGWLFLAKICVEMSYMNERDPLYHIHMREDLRMAMRDGQEKVNFFASPESK